MNELSIAIEQAVLECKVSGYARSQVKDTINNNTIDIVAEWVTLDDETCVGNGYDVIEVYITINGIAALTYAVKETLTEA